MYTVKYVEQSNSRGGSHFAVVGDSGATHSRWNTEAKANEAASKLNALLAEKWNLQISGTKEVYITHNGKFVARFKYSRPKANANHFAKALKNLFTPDQYFALLANGLAPLEAMRMRGYVSLNEVRARAALAAHFRSAAQH